MDTHDFCKYAPLIKYFMVFYILQVVQIVLQFSVELNIQEDYKSCVFKLTADTSDTYCKMN